MTSSVYGFYVRHEIFSQCLGAVNVSSEPWHRGWVADESCLNDCGGTRCGHDALATIVGVVLSWQPCSVQQRWHSRWFERLMIQNEIYWSCVTCYPNVFRAKNNYTTHKNICWSCSKMVNVLAKLRSAGSNMFWRRSSLNSWASTRRRPRLEILSPRLHNLVVLTPEAWHDDNSAKLRYNSDRFT